MSTVRTLTPLLLACSLAGCNGAFWGNLAVLMVTIGIFFGTLSLGRVRGETTRSTDGPGRPTTSRG